MQDSSDLKYELLDKESLYSGFFKMQRYTFRCQKFEGGWSETFQREIFERGHAAAVLLIDPEQEVIVLVEQFRPGAVKSQKNPWLLETVAGMIEAGEAPDEVIRRETLEEAGCEVKRLVKIYEYLVSPGGMTERVWLFAGEIDATDLPEVAGLDHEHEDIKIHKIAFKQAFEMLDTGIINNAMTLIALQWLKLNLPDLANIWRE